MVEDGTIVLEMIISVWPRVGTGAAGCCLRVADKGCCCADGAAGAGRTGTDVVAGALDWTVPLEKKLVRAATILPPTGLLLALLVAGGGGGAAVVECNDSALSKLSKLESACSVNGDRVAPRYWPIRL